MDSKSILECAAREIWEEASLSVDLYRIVYLLDFISREPNTRHFKMFTLAKSFPETPTTENVIGLPA